MNCNVKKYIWYQILPSEPINSWNSKWGSRILSHEEFCAILMLHRICTFIAENEDGEILMISFLMNCVTRFLHLWAWIDLISCRVPLNIPFRFVELDFDSVEIFIVNYEDINIIWSTPTKHRNLIYKKMMWLIHNKRG